MPSLPGRRLLSFRARRPHPPGNIAGRRRATAVPAPIAACPRVRGRSAAGELHRADAGPARSAAAIDPLFRAPGLPAPRDGHRRRRRRRPGASLPADPRIRYLRIWAAVASAKSATAVATLPRVPSSRIGTTTTGTGREGSARNCSAAGRKAPNNRAARHRVLRSRRTAVLSATPTTYARLFVAAVHGGTLVFRRSIYNGAVRYPNVSLAEDALFLRAALARGARLLPVAAMACSRMSGTPATAGASPVARNTAPPVGPAAPRPVTLSPTMIFMRECP